MTVDYSSPAEALAVLRPAYYQLLAGVKVQSIDIPTANGGQRRVTYHQTDVKALGAEVRRLEGLVASATSSRPKRFAIRAG